MRWEARVVGKVHIPPEKMIVLSHARLNRENYSGRDLLQFSSLGCRFEDCDFTGIRIMDASFGSGREMSEYIDCAFDGARIQYLGGGYARFERCSFRNVHLHGWKCSAVELVDCVFSGVLRESIFNGTVPEEYRVYVKRDRNEFRGNDFSAMTLASSAEFVGEFWLGEGSKGVI
jgi:uncharacterized protein YjbI with pentapeptide repeats